MMMMRRAAFVVSLVIMCGCGRILEDTDAGDAGDASPSDAITADAQFACGEGNTFVICDPTNEYCKLVKSSHAHAYTCEPGGLPPTCAALGFPVASSPGDCGCYEAANGEVFVVVCE